MDQFRSYMIIFYFYWLSVGLIIIGLSNEFTSDNFSEVSFKTTALLSLFDFLISRELLQIIGSIYKFDIQFVRTGIFYCGRVKSILTNDCVPIFKK